jgi:hypothetical protein
MRAVRQKQLGQPALIRYTAASLNLASEPVRVDVPKVALFDPRAAAVMGNARAEVRADR